MTLEDKLRNLRGYERFLQRIKSNKKGLDLGYHQSYPVYEAVENGLKRFLLAYSTSAGKTAITLELLRQLKERNPKEKALIVAPYQTVTETWNEKNVLEHSVPFTRLHVLDDISDLKIPSDTDILVVNYDKLPDSFNYLTQIVGFAKNVGLFILDECHNVKNPYGKRSKGIQRVIEANPDSILMLLSASPVPNRPCDAGMILYMLDPKRYSYYKDHKLDYQKDWESICEAIELGIWREFSREQVSEFHNLPELIIRDPVSVDMTQEDVENYLRAYTGFYQGVFEDNERRIGVALNQLEKAALQSLIHSPSFREYLQSYIRDGKAINIFSRLKTGFFDADDEIISGELIDLLRSINGFNNIEVINGDIRDPNKRLEIQRRFARGEIDALINQWGCTSEGFSEVAGDRPVVVIPLYSPFDPGRMEQIIGRSYRVGQRSPVEIALFHPDDSNLRLRIGEFVNEAAKRKCIKLKGSWSPTLFHEDIYKVLLSKREAWEAIRNHSRPPTYNGRLDVGSIEEYGRFCIERVVTLSSRIRGFGNGTRYSLVHVGKNYEEGLKQDHEPLGEDYDRQDILLFAPGKINLFLAEQVEKLKMQNHQQNMPWTVSDWGCCSSAPFTQARLFWQTLQKVRGKDIRLDHLVNMDGVQDFVVQAEQYLRNSEWIQTIPKLKGPFTDEELKKVFGLLTNPKYLRSVLDKLEFVCANFVKDKLPKKRYDAVVTSQCLQYNDQVRERDIEDIVINVNRSIRLGGYHLAVLTSNSFDKSFTKPSDFENFKKLVNTYGFDIIYADHITGKTKEGKTTVKPFYFVLSQKNRNHNQGYQGEHVQIYSSTFEVLTGGIKTETFSIGSRERRQTQPELPEVYVTKDNTPYSLK